MKEVTVVYKGGKRKETFKCGNCFAHSSGGWFLIDGMSAADGGIFISSADVRKIYITVLNEEKPI